jgi:hypothetical protein
MRWSACSDTARIRHEPIIEHKGGYVRLFSLAVYDHASSLVDLLQNLRKLLMRNSRGRFPVSGLLGGIDPRLMRQIKVQPSL